jgi:pimeloyl-ACP methyl ester carboxylesterase
MSGSSFADSAVGLMLDDGATKGLRPVVMDIAGYGHSTAMTGLTMDTWLSDIAEIFQAHVGGPAIWTGSSIGAWLMLLMHNRQRDWFRALCALGPAFDWDRQYVDPAIRDGRLVAAADGVSNADGTLTAPASLLMSMPRHHVLHHPVTLGAPMHVIFGGRDELAPAEATKRLIDRARGAPCTGDLLPEADHGVSKLDSALSQHRYAHWLRAQFALAQQARP